MSVKRGPRRNLSSLNLDKYMEISERFFVTFFFSYWFQATTVLRSFFILPDCHKALQNFHIWKGFLLIS